MAVCSKCGKEMNGPGDWGVCFSPQSCLERRVDASQTKLDKMTKLVDGLLKRAAERKLDSVKENHE